MGGSVAGLSAAAALTGLARSVTLLERDPDPRDATPRKGTPQCHHAHVLLNLGARSLAVLFPGVLDELRARGGGLCDAADTAWCIHDEWRPRFAKGVQLRLQTRPLLEACLREDLQARSGVSLRFDAAIDEPVFDAAAGEVRGVRLASGEVLAADLVVDATGRGTRSPTWFERWGLARPEEQIVEVGVGYVSALFEIPEGIVPSDVLMISPNPPHNRRGGVCFRVEGQRWMVTLYGYHGDHAPTDLAGFVAWSSGLARPELHRVLLVSRPLGELRKFTYPRQVRWRYEDLPRLPGGYVVHGDAVCSFDPVYGQGMSVAAAEAVALRDVLSKQGPDVCAIQAAFARILDTPWQSTCTEAHLWAETRGWRPSGTRLLQRFTERMHRVGATDHEVFAAFLDVVHLDRPPTSLFTPRILWKLARGPASRPPAANE